MKTFQRLLLYAGMRCSLLCFIHREPGVLVGVFPHHRHYEKVFKKLCD